MTRITDIRTIESVISTLRNDIVIQIVKMKYEDKLNQKSPNQKEVLGSTSTPYFKILLDD